MTKAEDDLEIVRGSGNVFHDMGIPDADTEEMKSALAAEIIKAMREQGLTHEAAAKKAGVQRADISRVCNVDLDRFTHRPAGADRQPARAPGRSGGDPMSRSPKRRGCEHDRARHGASRAACPCAPAPGPGPARTDDSPSAPRRSVPPARTIERVAHQPTTPQRFSPTTPWAPPKKFLVSCEDPGCGETVGTRWPGPGRACVRRKRLPAFAGCTNPETSVSGFL